MSKEERSINAPREADEAVPKVLAANPRFVKSYETAVEELGKYRKTFISSFSERRPRERRTLKVRKTLPGYSLTLLTDGQSDNHTETELNTQY
jgi:hypothetical protein